MSQSEPTYTVKSLIVTAVGTLIATVAALEISGKIDHSDNKDHVPVGEFEAVHVKPDETFQMSKKPSELHAVCEQGYLAIAADADPSFRGILVDYKNRGVRCSRGPAPAHDRPVRGTDNNDSNPSGGGAQ